MTVKEFVGRSSQLAQIRQWLQRPTGGLVLITGAGGIGKTSLLQKIMSEYSVDPGFIVDYFDLAEQPVTMINQVVHLARRIGFENLPKFEQMVTELGSQSGVSTEIYQLTAGEAVQTAITEISSYLQSQNKKLLLLTDTFEIALKYNSYEDRRVTKSYEELRKIPNTYFVVAGRDKVHDDSVKEAVYPLMTALFSEENIHYIELAGFDPKEVQAFFAELDEYNMIPAEMREKLYLLTAGRPILLSLAVEWLQRDIPLPEMLENSVDELRNQMASEADSSKLFTKFEFELVSRVRKLQSPLDISILYMAQIDRRMDADLLCLLLEMDEKRARVGSDALLKLSFVKEFVGSMPPKWTLHDEMTVLVNKYAWPALDPDAAERTRLTRKVIQEYYLPRIQTIKGQKKELLQQEKQTTILQDVQSRESDWERWLLEAETLYYSLKISKETGYAYFDELYYDKEQSNIRDQFLIDELKRAGVYDEEKIELRKSDDLRRRGLTDDARKICSQILQKPNLAMGDQIHAYTNLGLIDAESNPTEAEANFCKALELAESVNDIRVQSILQNNLGRLYRSTSRLDKSIKHYKEALELARRLGNSEMVSTARNNLAWTYRLDGNLIEADALCRLAIADHRKRGHERLLALALLTRADIDRDRGDLQNAEKHAKQAFEIFSRLEDSDGKIQAYRTLATTARILQKFEQALHYLEAGIALVEKRNSPIMLASLKQLYGRTIRHYVTYLRENSQGEQNDQVATLFDKALDVLQESIALAEQTHNRWEVARSEIEIALILILRSDLDDEDELNVLLVQVWDAAYALKDELLMGYVFENRARIELLKRNFLKAGKAFGEAACHISKRTGLEARLAFDRLHNELLDDVLADEERNDLAMGILDQLSTQDCAESPALMALTMMCKQILGLPI